MHNFILEWYFRRKWIKRLPKVGHKTMKKLFLNFKKYTEKSIKKEVVKLYNQIQDTINIENTIFTNITKTRYGGTDIFLGVFWQENELYGITYKAINNDIFDNVDSIVLVDDFMGSGDSVIRELNKLKDLSRIINIKILILTFITSYNAIERINQYGEDERLNIHIYYNYLFRPAFEIGYIFCKPNNLVHYNEMCDQISINEFRLGYNNDQALHSFYYNTPNNTLGIFWSDENGNVPFYKRHKKRLTLKEIQNRKKNHGIKPYKFGIDNSNEYREILLLVYLCEFGLNKAKRIQEKFGMNIAQLIQFVKECKEKAYITNVGKKIILTESGEIFITNKTYDYVKQMYLIAN